MNAVKDAEKARKWQILKSVLGDWQIYLQALVYWSNIVPNIGLKFSRPQIIKNMGYTSSNAQLLTVPPYMCGAISAFVSGMFADRLTWRMPFIVGAQTLVLIAFGIVFSFSGNVKDHIAPSYFGVILACFGLYPISPGTTTWTLNNQAGPTKRAQGIAFMICMGNAGSIVSSYIYVDSESPRYPTGYGTSMAFAGVGILAALALETGYWYQNRRRAAISDDEINAKYTQEDLDVLGDRSPLFRYTL